MARSFPPSPNITHKNPKPSPLSKTRKSLSRVKKKGKQLQCRVFLCVCLCWKSPLTPQHTPTFKAIQKKPVNEVVVRSQCRMFFFRTILIVEQVRVVFGIPQTKGFFLSKNTSKSANSLPKARPKKKTENKKEKRKKKKEKKEQNRGYEEECSKKNKQIQRRGCVFARYPLSKFSFFFLLMTNHGTLSPMVL